MRAKNYITQNDNVKGVKVTRKIKTVTRKLFIKNEDRNVYKNCFTLRLRAIKNAQNTIEVLIAELPEIKYESDSSTSELFSFD